MVSNRLADTLVYFTAFLALVDNWEEVISMQKVLLRQRISDVFIVAPIIRMVISDKLHASC